MATKILILVTATAVLVGGCASRSSWTPTVDTYGNSRAQYLSRDMEECRLLAERASGGGGSEAVGGAVTGGLVGAALGAAIGAALGNAGRGAAVGAAAGGIGYGAEKAAESDAIFKQSFRNCMRNRGHNVVG